MRVYEFAKELGLSSKELLALLHKAGFEASSHMSVLPEGADVAVKKALRPQDRGSDRPKVTETKHKKPGPAKVAAKITKPKAGPVQRPAPKPVPTAPAAYPPRRKAQKVAESTKAIPEIILKEEMPLCRVAQLLGRSEGELLLVLLKKGVVCSRNHTLTVPMISDLAHHFGVKVVVSERPADSLAEQRLEVEEAMAAGEESRWPIVVVMGHVDHGKTSLLDYVRKMNTAAKEKGGITQHLSAYEVDSAHGKIVFLDTPGHEAFSYMRKRGTSVTDVVVLVVAADDGVMPQTIEAINHIKAADVPLVVAINKIDKVDRASAVERVKRQLAQHDLLPEDWGGEIVCVPISAKTGEGIEELLEMIVLQSQMIGLSADPGAPARGFVLESKLETGLGPVATVICLNGTLRIGDYFVCGNSSGKVRLLIDCRGERVRFAGPSTPVQVVGFDSFVSLGDWLTAVSAEEYLREKAIRRKAIGKPSAMPDVSATVRAGEVSSEKEFLLIKTDTRGSREAVMGAIEKVNKAHPDIPCNFQVAYSGIGGITEKDVEFAASVGAHVFGLHVKAEKNALVQAREQGVFVKSFDIIYHMVEELERLMKSREQEVIVRTKVGEAVVRKVFPIKKKEVIAGCYVSDGAISKGDVVVCYRDKEEIGEGKVISLQRERKAAKEVAAGFECGFITDRFHDWQEGDVVHAFKEETKKQSEARS